MFLGSRTLPWRACGPMGTWQDHLGTKLSTQESVFTSSSGPGQAVGLAPWTQDGFSIVITISRDKEPLWTWDSGEPKEQDTQWPLDRCGQGEAQEDGRDPSTACSVTRLCMTPLTNTDSVNFRKWEDWKFSNKHVTLYFPQIQFGEINI